MTKSELDLSAHRERAVAPFPRLAARIAEHWPIAVDTPSVIGLSGGQGAGKSTLAMLLSKAHAQRGGRNAVLALDDFYRTRADRRALAEEVHPLMITRGPPGTHEVSWMEDSIHRLMQARGADIPCFDKGSDDRQGTRSIVGRLDVLLVEGWCVGAAPLDPSSLATPINALERNEDPKGEWREAVAHALATDYQRLWATIDERIFLRVPDFDAVRRFRLEQEADRPVAQRLGPEAIDRFVQHYERITRAMLDEPSSRSQTTVQLGPERNIEAAWTESAAD